MKNVTIYSTQTCHFCHMTKDFFKENNITFTDLDITSDEKNKEEMLERSGQMSVPVIFVGDEMVVGFNESKLKELLEIK